MYIEAWDDYVKIHCEDNVYVKKKTLSFYESCLNKNVFVRCHRSFLVNITQISAIDHPSGDQWELRLKNGFHLPVSRQGYARLKALLNL
jgi:two-component system LytT family response regulator